MNPGDIIRLTQSIPLFGGDIPAGRTFRVVSVFRTAHGDRRVNLSLTGSDTTAISAADPSALEVVSNTVIADEIDLFAGIFAA